MVRPANTLSATIARVAAVACAAVMVVPAFANEERSGQIWQAKDCEQDDSHVKALRACTALLDAGGLDDESRQRYRVRRGFAWLADDDGGDAAVDDFTYALGIAPANVKALEGRARAHTLLGDHVKAAEDWSAILATNPDAKAAEAALMARGASQLAAGGHERALADFAKVLGLNPRSEKAHIARANVFAALNDRAQVLHEYGLALAINGGSYEVYLWRAQMAETWGETQSAIDNYFAALRIDPRKAWDARKSLKRLGIDSPSE